MTNKIYIYIGFETYEHQDYKRLQNKLNKIENNQDKLRFLKDNYIAYYWEEQKAKIEQLKQNFYYHITFEVDELI